MIQSHETHVQTDGFAGRKRRDGGSGDFLAMRMPPRSPGGSAMSLRSTRRFTKRLVEASDARSPNVPMARWNCKSSALGRPAFKAACSAQVRDGRLQMTATTCTQLMPTVPLCSIPSIGFLFGDYANLWPAMDGDLGRLISSQIKTQIGTEVLEKIWDFGFRNITTSAHPIKKASDMSGLKIRTQIDADEMDLFRALGAIPIVITLPYLRMALQHHQIDGQEGMLPLVEYARLNEVQSYCAMTHHIWDGLWLCVNAAAWAKLPDRLQRIVANTLNGAAQRQRDDSAAMEDPFAICSPKGA